MDVAKFAKFRKRGGSGLLKAFLVIELVKMLSSLALAIPHMLSPCHLERVALDSIGVDVLFLLLEMVVLDCGGCCLACCLAYK